MRKALERIEPYSPGKPIEEVQRELGIREVIKLASNENPLGPSPKAIEAALSALRRVSFYPDSRGHDLKDAIARRYGLSPENVCLGNGADEIIRMLAEAFLEEGDIVLSVEPTFTQYKFAADLMGQSYMSVPLIDMQFDIDGLKDAITSRTKLIFISNPNNPTGSILRGDQLATLISFIPETALLVLDEAYADYVTDKDFQSGSRYVGPASAAPNVVVVRTFSKLYGLAGLRVGYCLGHSRIIAALERVRSPFNVNLVAQAAAIAALDDHEHVERTIALNESGKSFLYREFERLGLDYVPTEANFILVRLGARAREVCQHLLRVGVIIRSAHIFGLNEYARITIGTAGENKRLVSALEDVLPAVYGGNRREWQSLKNAL
ncbi:MAG TPA: histidinol-phosphate transaminase [Firmicutes bacterium]|nr:histidinol-phosphate transaminase [Bacillota bacterium]